MKMKLFAPPYFKEFKCIAEKCRHSCCVNWEIDVDGEALARYEALGDFGKDIISGIDFGADVPHFRLTPDGRCPNLDANGLCRIISLCGENYLCDICREHPRFFNTVQGRCEAGIGAVCEEGARLILESENYFELCEIGETERDFCESEFDILSERSRVFSILSDRSRAYNERLSELYSVYGISPQKLGDAEWREIIENFEYLSEESRALFLSYLSKAQPPAKTEIYLERALAYFVYRHASTAFTYTEFVFSLGLAFFLERLFASVIAAEKNGTADFCALALRLISEEIEYCEENTENVKFALL